LIIVESPAKASTIKKYLQGEYEVEASAGHIKDLPERTLGVDVNDGFATKFEVVKGKRKIVDKLRKAAATADCVYLAPDPDREGEAIAWHIAEEIRDVAPEIRRVLFHEITKDAVRKALEFPRELDAKMYDSQLSRRILDRLVGYQISPLLWRKVQGGLSAGRVQSVAVRLVVDREREIEAFQPREYWVLTADVDRVAPFGPHPFQATLRRVDGKKADVSSGDTARLLLATLNAADWKVLKVERKERRRPSQPPFITSSLQQEASRLLRFSPSHTMAVAQRLYEGVDIGDEGQVGLITYMRTDSLRMSDEAVQGIREVIAQRYGAAYVPAKPVTYKNKRSAQDAHEAIRPTSALRTPSEVKGFLERDEFRLYSLVWARAMACQMMPALYDQTAVDIEAGPAEFRATGSVLRFEGYLAAARDGREAPKVEEAKPDAADGDDEFDGDGSLPPDLVDGEPLRLRNLDGVQKFTEPPPRFNEATLVRELEERGIGRPSTYASIVGTVQTKGYVKKVEGRLRPSELGRVVTDLLVRHFSDIVDFDFTARMEESLDKVEEGVAGRLELLGQFWEGFDKTLKQAATEMRSVKSDAMPAGVDCEKCGKPLLIRLGKNGAFLGCSGFPECRNTKEFERDENGHVTPSETESPGKCPQCESELQVRSGKFGKFIACTSYPKCSFTRPYTRVERCPVVGCEGHLAEKRSKKGKPFFGCDQYPKCKFLTSYEPVSEICPSCAAPTLFARSFRAARTLLCQREGCGYTRREAAANAGGERASGKVAVGGGDSE
jgi:DNA topoisomerase-1